jgi:MarR family transcriptional regulator for hemolysin
MTLPPSQAAFLQTKSHQILREVVLQALAPHGINVTEWRALTAMAQAHDGIRLSEIARYISVEAPMVTLIAQKLVKYTFATFKKDSTDKRAKNYLPTEAGLDFLKTVAHDIEGALRPLFANVSTEDLQAYFRVLQGIIAAEEGAQEA